MSLAFLRGLRKRALYRLLEETMAACTTIQRLRKPKVMDMSIFDWATSLLGAWLLGLYFKIHGVQWIGFLVAWVALGVASHKAFGVDSMFGYYLGLNAKPVRTECS